MFHLFAISACRRIQFVPVKQNAIPEDECHYACIPLSSDGKETPSHAIAMHGIDYSPLPWAMSGQRDRNQPKELTFSNNNNPRNK